MNKPLIIPYILVSTLIVINTVIYCKYVLVDEDNIKLFIKWIPALLLWIQSFNSAIIYQKQNDRKSVIYASLFGLGYVFCGIGDIILIFPGWSMYISAMILFMIAYLWFGSAQISDIRSFPNPNKSIGKFIILTIFWLVSLFGLIYLILQIAQNQEYDNIAFIIGVSIYFFAMMYAGILSCIKFLLYQTLVSALSFIGIILFIISDFIMVLHDVRYNLVELEIAVMVLYWMGLTILSWSVCQKKVQYVILPNSEINF